MLDARWEASDERALPFGDVLETLDMVGKLGWFWQAGPSRFRIDAGPRAGAGIVVQRSPRTSWTKTA
ncbi:MAG TPA: hypothetical protein VGK73_25405 [Polyangiaceae bacterium]